MKQKARLVVDGNKVTCNPDIFGGTMVTNTSVRLLLFVNTYAGYDSIITDIINAYLNVPTPKLMITKLGTKIGILADCWVCIIKALYGLRASSAAWDRYFSQIIRFDGFIPSRYDPNL